MPRCINNCYNLESFWKNWHASFNKWLVRLAFYFFTFSISCIPVIFIFTKFVFKYMYIPLGGSERKLLNIWVYSYFILTKFVFRYMYIPLGGSQRKLLNIWVIFTFVAIWHDLEWYYLLFQVFQSLFPWQWKRSMKFLNPTPHLTVYWFWP